MNSTLGLLNEEKEHVMLRLDRVSKFYSTNGVVTAGFSKVSLDFEIGEFVAITGESGSGKSTLLNVISGLDSYEEGEMYIFGQPTSGYGSADMEDYRKRYIGNIFQTFNLINHYTVYQNIEMVLLLSGYDKSEIQPLVEEIIEKVGLVDYRNTKASKLSGGQKQRVAIARALAKETPIIVADEPTGNLDAASAADIIKLLAGLSKEKLIIIVTHNYEQVEPYVTRKISMHDGRIAEDKRIARETPGDNNSFLDYSEASPLEVKEHSDKSLVKEARHDGLSVGNTFRLGARNAFSLPAKFLLLLFVFIFLSTGTFASYSAYKGMESDLSNNSFGYIFTDVSPTRMLLTKSDGEPFTNSDFERIREVEHVSHLETNDLLMDNSFVVTDLPQAEVYASIEGGYEIDFWVTVGVLGLESFGDREIIEGRLPEAPDEALLLVEEGGFIHTNKIESIMSDSSSADEDVKYIQYSEGALPADGFKCPIKIVGYAYFTEQEMRNMWSRHLYFEGALLMTPEGLDVTETLALVGNTLIEGKIDERVLTIGEPPWDDVWILVDETVPQGTVIVPDYIADMILEEKSVSPENEQLSDLEWTTLYDDAIGETFKLRTRSKYFDREKDLKITDVVEGETRIYVNPADIMELYAPSEKMQVSAIMDSAYYSEETQAALEDAGYRALYLNKTADKQSAIEKALVGAMRVVVLVLLLAILFFVIYFITKLIMKSQNVYYSTVRMLGGSRSACSGTLLAELLVVFHIAFGMCLAIMLKVRALGSSIMPAYFVRLVRYIEPGDYVILYLVVLAMTLLLAYRYSSQMFKKTAMNAYREEV